MIQVRLKVRNQMRKDFGDEVIPNNYKSYILEIFCTIHSNLYDITWRDGEFKNC